MLCGVALGYFLSHLQMMRHMEGMQKRGPKMFVPGILRSLEYGLDLRRDQSKKIEKVLKETAQEVQDFHQQTVHPKIVEIFEAGMEKIEKELTAKQKEEFQEMGNPFHPRKPNQSFDREGHYPPPPPHHCTELIHLLPIICTELITGLLIHRTAQLHQDLITDRHGCRETRDHLVFIRDLRHHITFLVQVKGATTTWSQIGKEGVRKLKTK